MEEGRTQHPNIAKAARLCFRWQLFALRHHAPWTQLAAMLLATTHFKASTEVEDSWELRTAMQSREVAKWSQIEAIQDTFQKPLLKKQSFHMGLSENVGYIPNYSHLIGIMISKTIGFTGTQHFQTHPYFYSKKCSLSLWCLAILWHFIWHFHGSSSQGPEHGLRAQHPRRVASGLLRVASRVWPSAILEKPENCADCSWSIEIFLISFMWFP